MKGYYRNQLRTYCDVCMHIVPKKYEGRLFVDGDDILDVCGPRCAEAEFNARYQPAFYFIVPCSNTGVTFQGTHLDGFDYGDEG